MIKMKKCTMILLAVVLALLLGLCIYGIVKHYQKITLTGLHDTVPYGFGKKATVILLAGQSNAAGCSRDEYLFW